MWGLWVARKPHLYLLIRFIFILSPYMLKQWKCFSHFSWNIKLQNIKLHPKRFLLLEFSSQFLTSTYKVQRSQKHHESVIPALRGWGGDHFNKNWISNLQQFKMPSNKLPCLNVKYHLLSMCLNTWPLAGVVLGGCGIFSRWDLGGEVGWLRTDLEAECLSSASWSVPCNK